MNWVFSSIIKYLVSIMFSMSTKHQSLKMCTYRSYPPVDTCDYAVVRPKYIEPEYKSMCNIGNVYWSGAFYDNGL